MDSTDNISQTILHDWHVKAGARMVPFGGFDMPAQYGGILSEHLTTRRKAGLFDISHMGRFLFSGQPVDFLQYVLTNNVNALREVGMAQYTLIPDGNGAAVDDAYLYRVGRDAYMLVVNAANRAKDWNHLSQLFSRFPGLKAENVSDDVAMVALQGPESEAIFQAILDRAGNSGVLPENEKNRLSLVSIDDAEMVVARTGYTGEPVGLELFPPARRAVSLWEQLLETGEKHGITPVGLGARDTLRLEAGYPLYGDELGDGPDGRPIPIFAVPIARAATRFDEGKGDFIGRAALFAQHREVSELLRGAPPKPMEERLVPRLIWPLAILNEGRTAPGQNPPRHGYELRHQDEPAGWVTSGSTVPYWKFAGMGLLSHPTEEQDRRALGLAYVDAALLPGELGRDVEVVKPNSLRPIPALLVQSNLRAAPPFARPVIHPEQPRRGGSRTAPPSARPVIHPEQPRRGGSPTAPAVPTMAQRGEQLFEGLVRCALENSESRQRQMVNLIPSEQTPSLLVRLLSILDPAGRYAEHNRLQALGKDADDIFHYQGTGFIKAVEADVQLFFKEYLGCSEVEARAISGQMANRCVFGGLLDYTNRFRKEEPRRLGYVFVNALRNGGHLSAQLMGALKNHVSWDPVTGRASVVAFPVRNDYPYRIDLEQTKELIDRYEPQLIVLGKSMVLHPEPVREMAEFTRGRGTFIMYDMAHVLGLAGPHFQEPFKEGAHFVTGSTHKTFFGTQRGIIAGNMSEDSELWPLWEKVVNLAFPGSTSNHHPGTLLGLLGACYEMMAFGDGYQRQVLANAKAFARALKENGLSVEGDPAVGYTETHQVLLRVGSGPEAADRLERNGVVVNSQVLPSDASVTGASGIRTGVQEMTRFGMKEEDFRELAGYVAEILRGKEMADQIARFRQRHLEMQYCFSGEKAERMARELLGALGAR